MCDTFLKFDVTKEFPEFSLECRGAFRSEITAIFGPSGSGKTTLLNCISGLTQPDSGEIVVDGETLYSSSVGRSVPPEQRRIGYVFQESSLFPNMTVRDNVLYGYNLTPELRRETDPEQLIELLDLGSLMCRSVSNLSGGERQRVALARALASSPNLLLLDEPMSSLDVGFRGIIIEYLKRIRREIETPMVYVSHSISEVMALAEMAFVLHRGKSLAYGRPSQVLVDPAVTALADYSTLENLLEAKAVGQPDHGLVELQVGNSKWLVQSVNTQLGDTVLISVAAGDIIIALDISQKISARNTVRALIADWQIVDRQVLVYADVGEQVVVEITLAAMKDLDLRKGQEVYLIINANSILVLDRPEPTSA